MKETVLREPTDGDGIGNPATPRKWRRSGKCANGACIEVAGGAQVFIRDSKLSDDSPIITISRAAFGDLVNSIKRGELGPVA